MHLYGCDRINKQQQGQMLLGEDIWTRDSHQACCPQVVAQAAPGLVLAFQPSLYPL